MRRDYNFSHGGGPTFEVFHQYNGSHPRLALAGISSARLARVPGAEGACTYMELTDEEYAFADDEVSTRTARSRGLRR